MGLLLGLLVAFTVVVALLVLAGLVFQQIGSARDARRFPPPGRLVDVGVHRLHIYCTGSGTPAVVMDSGFPGTSLSWTFVQPEVAKFTCACSYDRAGLGWSDAGPMPRTSRWTATESSCVTWSDGGDPGVQLETGPEAASVDWSGAIRAEFSRSGFVFLGPIGPKLDASRRTSCHVRCWLTLRLTAAKLTLSNLAGAGANRRKSVGRDKSGQTTFSSLLRFLFANCRDFPRCV